MQPKHNAHYVCWLDFMADYRLDVCYRPDKANTVLNSLLRPLCSSPLAPLKLAKASIVGTAGAL